VKRLSKVILILLVLAIIAIVGGGLALRGYVQSDRGRAQLEDAVGKALKLPVKIGKVSVAFPAALRIENVLADNAAQPGQPKITASVLRGSLAIRPLLSGELEFRDVTLEEPRFDWPQTKDGRWAWPGPEKVKTAPKPAAPRAEARPPSRKTVVNVRGIKILRGAVRLQNASGEPVVVASDVTTDFAEVSEQRLLGAITVGRLVWGEHYVFDQVRTNLRYASDHLELNDVEAASFGGTIRGSYAMDTGKDGQPFKAKLDVRGADLSALATAGGWGDGEVAGRLSGAAELSGRTDRIERLEGSGRLAVEGGRFRKLEMFESIAQLIGLGELANFQPRETSADFKLRDEKMFFESLVFATENLRITAAGVARFDGKLALDARLTVPEKLVQTIPEIARGSFVKLDSGERGLDFKISGKTSKPKTDLAERLVGGKVQDKLGDLLGSLFGSKPEKKDEKKSEKQPAKTDEPNR